MAEMGGTDERTVSIREVVNATSNVVTTAATGNIQSWATNGELGYSGDGLQDFIAKDQGVFEFL